MMTFSCTHCFQRAELCECPASVKRATPLQGSLVDLTVLRRPKPVEPPKDAA